MWLDPKEQSEWALKQCLNGNDTKEIRDLIEGVDLYKYCKIIKLRKNLMKKLHDQSSKVYLSFIYVKNRLEFYNFMSTNNYKINNIRFVKTRRE